MTGTVDESGPDNGADKGPDSGLGGLWHVSFGLAGEPTPDVLEALEALALSTSIFASEVDENDDALAWRADMLFAQKPDEVALTAQLDALLNDHGIARDGSLGIDWLPHQDWLAAVRMVRAPLQVGRFFVHGEEDPIPARPRIVPLLIEAGLAFGSGEHATTSACLEAFDRLLRRRRFGRVLDMGCGSAILAIAAAKADHKARVLAADNDPLAVTVARDNCRRNHVAGRVQVVTSDGYDHPVLRRAGPFDLIFANILADPLIAMANDLRRHLAPGGVAVLSGLLDRQAPAVLAAHRERGLREVARVERHPWVGLVLRRPSPTARSSHP